MGNKCREHIQHIGSVRKLSEATQLEHIQHIGSVRKLREATQLQHIRILGYAFLSRSSCVVAFTNYLPVCIEKDVLEFDFPVIIVSFLFSVTKNWSEGAKACDG